MIVSILPTVWAIIVFAVVIISAVLTKSTPLTKFIHLKAVTAIRTNVFIPVKSLRAKLMFAVIALCTFFAKSAVRALVILRALSAFRAQMLFIIRRFYTVSVAASFTLAVLQTAFPAKSAIITKNHSASLSTFSALFAKPAVLFAAVFTVFTFSTVFTPLYAIFSKAVTAIRAVFFFDSTALT